MSLQQRDERRRSTCPTPYDRDSKERQREPIPRVLPDVDTMYTICSLFAICSIRHIFCVILSVGRRALTLLDLWTFGPLDLWTFGWFGFCRGLSEIKRLAVRAARRKSWEVFPK